MVGGGYRVLAQNRHGQSSSPQDATFCVGSRWCSRGGCRSSSVAVGHRTVELWLRRAGSLMLTELIRHYPLLAVWDPRGCVPRLLPEHAATADRRLPPVAGRLRLVSPKPRTGRSRSRRCVGGLSCSSRCVGRGRRHGTPARGRLLYFHVIDMAVLPAHQRRGLGDAMLTALLDHVRDTAPQGAYVNLVADEPGRRLYERHGFSGTAPVSLAMARWLDRG